MTIGYASSAVAPRSRAKGTVARASSPAMPWLRWPGRVWKHVTAQTPASSLSSARPGHTTRLRRSAPKAVRGSTATQPTASPSR